MSIKISESEMSSDVTRHTARRAADGNWAVTWLPGRALTQGQAVTAMTIAEMVVERAHVLADPSAKLWWHVNGWAEELGLAGADAVAMASASPEGTAPRRVRVIDPEPGPYGELLHLDEPTGRAVVRIDGQTTEMDACRLQYADDEAAL